MQKQSVDSLIKQAGQAWEIKDIPEVERLLIQATKVSKRSAKAWAHLAQFYTDQKDYKQAIFAHAATQKIQPMPKMLTSYATCFYHLGQLDNAFTHLKRALALDASQPSNTWYILANCFCYLHSVEDWHKLKELRPTFELSDWNQGVEQLFYTLSSYMLNNKKLFKKELSILAEIGKKASKVNVQGMSKKEISAIEKNTTHILIYIEYLEMISQHALWPNKETIELPTLHILGDSHTLACNNHTTNWQGKKHHMQTHLVMGLKAWHLRKETKGLVQEGFKKQLHNIPKNEPILIMCGEIDCRHDEGMLPAAAKSGKPLEHIVNDTAAGYINWVKENTAGHTITVAGVAAPHPEAIQRVTPKYQQLFINMIAAFNLQLKQKAKDSKIGFIDTHTFSANPKNGISKDGIHLDARHLTGESWAKAIQGNYISASK